MFETLYKTDSPKDFSNGEYYQVHLDFDPEQDIYFVRERHGWYNNQEKRAAHSVKTLEPLEPLEGFSTLKEARAAYEQHVQHRASLGFIHAFSIDFVNWNSNSYRRIGVKDI